MSNVDLVQMHCEHNSQKLYSALEALQSLNSDERKAVLAALKQDRDLPIRKYMAGYRQQLAANIGR